MPLLYTILHDTLIKPSGPVLNWSCACSKNNMSVSPSLTNGMLPVKFPVICNTPFSNSALMSIWESGAFSKINSQIAFFWQNALFSGAHHVAENAVPKTNLLVPMFHFYTL